jgi:hypothetical protein
MKIKSNVKVGRLSIPSAASVFGRRHRRRGVASGRVAALFKSQPLLRTIGRALSFKINSFRIGQNPPVELQNSLTESGDRIDPGPRRTQRDLFFDSAFSLVASTRAFTMCRINA